jgi:ribose 5-phosphate isomerase A
VANPRGGDNPYVIPDGHNIVDVRFYEGMKLFGEDAKVRGLLHLIRLLS